MNSTLAVSLHRASPQIQALQSTSPYLDLYTNSPTILRDDAPILNTVRPGQPLSPSSHAHPDPNYRFSGSAGYGARHVNDKAPFSLWDAEKHTFIHLTIEQFRWIERTYNSTSIHLILPFMIITTASPPQPISLTVGCVAAIFIAPNTPEHLEIFGNAAYANPRVPNPCPEVEWPKLSNPSRSQITEKLFALNQLMNVKAAFFLPTHNVIELDHDDGRTYKPASLPGKVGNRSTIYHHSDEPFLQAMQSFDRDRAINPASYAQIVSPGASLPQDDIDYLSRPPGIIRPGIRVSSGFLAINGPPGPETSSKATTAGVFLCNGAEIRISVAHQGFLNTREVYHPGPA